MKNLCLFVFAVSLCSAQYRVRVGGETVDMLPEDYVVAVLAGECGSFRNSESLNAMAVVARTYAASLRGRHAAEGFDFCSTTHCQRAEPRDVTERLRAAARATAGELLWFQGEPAFTVYTRNCGGRSEEAATVWPAVAAPYLSVHADPHCGTSAWKWQVRPDALTRALRASGLHCPNQLRNVTILERTGSGRAKNLVLDGDRRIPVSASSFRFAVGRELGWNTLRSDQYDVHANGDTIVFEGRGEGHGVGLCQLGAEQMAATGANYHEILAFYYPGAGPLKWQKVAGERIAVFASESGAAARTLAVAQRLELNIGRRFGWPPETGISIYVYPTLDSFRDVTGEPAWVAARTSGRRIDMQPTAVLESRGVLAETLQHELLHVSVEAHAAAGLPIWFREGLVGWLSNASHAGAADAAAIRYRGDEAQARQAYGAAIARVRELAHRYGSPTVLGWVVRGLPPEVMNAITKEAAIKSK